MVDMSEVRAGDEVRVFERWRNGQQNASCPGEVVKGGRTLATIRYRGSQEAFRLDTGYLNSKQYGTGTYFLTLDQVAASERESGALAVLKSAGFEVRPGNRPPGALIEALAEVARTFGKDTR